jgi:lysozyme family protein
MDRNFQLSLFRVLKHEGGYVDHPRDPGGETNLGVTRRTWENWVKRKCLPGEMRSLTPYMVEPLYKKNYWDAVRGDILPSGVDHLVFDFAVNAGPSRAKKTLQAALGVDDDGFFGPKTLAAVLLSDATMTVHKFTERKRAFYQSLPTFTTFGQGWLIRLETVKTEALAMTKD